MTKLDMPKAVFGGLALIAAAIFFGPGSLPAGASNGVQKVQICDNTGWRCADVGYDRTTSHSKIKVYGLLIEKPDY